MKCRDCISSFFRAFDLFSLTQFLRYNQDEDYKTVSGGVTSLLVVAIFIALFADTALATFDKTQVSWSTST
jgi:hypothetical protein